MNVSHTSIGRIAAFLSVALTGPAVAQSADATLSAGEHAAKSAIVSEASASSVVDPTATTLARNETLARHVVVDEIATRRLRTAIDSGAPRLADNENAARRAIVDVAARGTHTSESRVAIAKADGPVPRAAAK